MAAPKHLQQSNLFESFQQQQEQEQEQHQQQQQQQHAQPLPIFGRRRP